MGRPDEATRKVTFRAPKDSEPEPASKSTETREIKDYEGWITVEELAERLGIRKDNCYQLVRRHVEHERVYGRILISPEAAAEYVIRHKYTRRSKPGSGS